MRLVAAQPVNGGNVEVWISEASMLIRDPLHGWLVYGSGLDGGGNAYARFLLDAHCTTWLDNCSTSGYLTRTPIKSETHYNIPFPVKN